MKKTGTFQKLLSLVCTLAMIMAWLPILPAAAATPVLVEDFESTLIGSIPGTLVKSNQANGGTVSETVRSADGSKVLELVAQNGSGASKEARARIKTKEKWSQSYTVEWDMKNNSNAWTIFETYVRTGGYVRPRINSAGKMCFYVHEAAKVSGVMQGITSDITLKLKIWYTMRVQVTDELVTFSATERDTGKELGTISLAQSTATFAGLLQPYEFWFSYAASTKESNTDKNVLLIDNFRVYDGVGDLPAAPATPSAPATRAASDPRHSRPRHGPRSPLQLGDEPQAQLVAEEDPARIVLQGA